jgi:hypothetical protein
MSTDTLSKDLGAWEALSANVKARSPELPQLGETVQEMDGLIFEGRNLQSVQDIQRSQLRETNRRCQDLRRRGRNARNRLAAGVQSVFGVDSMVLVEFGVKPRLRKKRRILTPQEKVAKLEAELEVAKAAAAAAEEKKKG